MVKQPSVPLGFRIWSRSRWAVGGGGVGLWLEQAAPSGCGGGAGGVGLSGVGPWGRRRPAVGEEVAASTSSSGGRALLRRGWREGGAGGVEGVGGAGRAALAGILERVAMRNDAAAVMAAPAELAAASAFRATTKPDISIRAYAAAASPAVTPVAAASPAVTPAAAAGTTATPCL
ncbi:PE-PGRS family protein PE_PGRS17-like [Oryza brachyantha]|uniref:PE-PGRS family protein PE_PGRS17-like n=1 Tax=Oryza brachyantha TaxID=4533 RepID=UPI001AD9ABC0|nr:PE-PGRS family protein PE_PGRS17-like [Oryza brachyantha]